MPTRYSIKYVKGDKVIVLKVTDDRKCCKFKLINKGKLRQLHQLNRLFLTWSVSKDLQSPEVRSLKVARLMQRFVVFMCPFIFLQSEGSNVAADDAESASCGLSSKDHIQDTTSPPAESATVGEVTSTADAVAPPAVEDETRIRKREKKKQYLQRKRQRIESGKWVDSSVGAVAVVFNLFQRNLSVYITGLPDDTTAEEIASVFRRAGVIKIDPITTMYKIKLYTDDSGKFKNDARVTFVNKESVDFAIRYLDNYHFRENCVIHVEEARYDPHKYQTKSTVTLSAEEMRKRYLAAKLEQDRLQSWGEDIDDGSGRRIVICKPMFTAEDAWEYEADDPFYDDLREEVTAEVTKFVPVEKVTPIPRHPQGVVCVKLKTSAEAELFIAQFQNRLFDGRQLQVYFFDGKSDLQAQSLPSKLAHEKAIAEAKADLKSADDVACDWIDNQSSDEEFEIRTE
ncbi:HIV Tat-specific factor 1 -like protein [Babesia sp. Xinjiang]|uniref:HIV Tat-specific factor 1 -like protein n=1 Tax=Babesia sp. Xinjiang TaxID=462227 RepID=UPI000A2355C3|nr:HIV Tat-specific factor 1 -like protein [Babesia sp. Xinjiang]ORM39381.1 HIV Tat-specific factor 1 -like protein [Babesia sp. Xinjiang]